MKKFVFICLSFLFCLGAPNLCCPKGNTKDCQAIVTNNSANNTNVRNLTPRVLQEEKNSSPATPAVPNVLDDNQNTTLPKAEVGSDVADTSGEPIDEEMLVTPNQSPIFGFEFHGHGKIFRFNENYNGEELDPLFSFGGEIDPQIFNHHKNHQNNLSENVGDNYELITPNIKPSLNDSATPNESEHNSINLPKIEPRKPSNAGELDNLPKAQPQPNGHTNSKKIMPRTKDIKNNTMQNTPKDATTDTPKTTSKLAACKLLCLNLIGAKTTLATDDTKTLATAAPTQAKDTPLLAIVIDDFGGYERTGVETLLNSDVEISCAIIPFADNSEADYNAALAAGKEVILHMPMEAHVHLPDEWYGTVYIHNSDTPESAIEKLERCFETMPEAKGFNFHIGSGVSQNKELMKAMYAYAKQHNMCFLDSRTVMSNVAEQASHEAATVYIGRNVFLEPEKNRSYQGVLNRLTEAMEASVHNGYAVVIGHVGAEGGENTARCIAEHAELLAKQYGVKIVPLSQIYSYVINQQV